VLAELAFEQSGEGLVFGVCDQFLPTQLRSPALSEVGGPAALT
jgi:hypothetical protein